MKLLRKLIIIICCLLLSWGFVFPVNAQTNNSYFEVSPDNGTMGNWYDGWIRLNNTVTTNTMLRQFRFYGNSGGTFVGKFYVFIAVDNNDNNHVIAVAEKIDFSSFVGEGRALTTSGSYASPFIFSVSSGSGSVDGVNLSGYLFYHLGPASGDFSSTGDQIGILESSVLPVVDFDSEITFAGIYRHVYLDEPVVSYGTPSVDYTVSVAGTGQAASNNKDNITFHNYFQDGSPVPEEAVFSLRVVPGIYQASDRESVFVRTFQDFTLDTLDAFNLGDFSPGETASFVWSDIIPKFSLLERTGLGGVLTPVLNNNIWEMFGWSYQYQLKIGDYVSDWKTIYTATSSGASESYNITNTYYDETVYNAFQTINSVNNVTNNIYNYGGSEVPVSAPTPTPSPSPTPDSTVSDPESHGFLSRIVNFVKNIFSTLGNMFNWLKDLFTGNMSDYENQIVDETEDLMSDKGIMIQAFQAIDDLESSLENLPNLEPVISYNAIEVMGVNIVPAGVIDFTNFWSDIGITQEEVYSFTDFWIGFALFVTIGKKTLEILGYFGGNNS